MHWPFSQVVSEGVWGLKWRLTEESAPAEECRAWGLRLTEINKEDLSPPDTVRLAQQVPAFQRLLPNGDISQSTA